MGADGVVSRSTIARLAADIGEAYAAAGVREEGGNNRGDEVEFFLRLVGAAPGDPWCAAFISACLCKAHARALGLPEGRASLMGSVAVASARLVGLSASCIEFAESARRRGLFRPATWRPFRGDLVLFDFSRRGEPHHIGIVRASPGAGMLLTVEGNTSGGADGSQADGGGVFCRSRTSGFVYGFVSLSGPG